MRVQRQEQGALIDEIVPRVSDQADAVREETSHKFCHDDDGVEGER
jgi:hypothetical protein